MSVLIIMGVLVRVPQRNRTNRRYTYTDIDTHRHTHTHTHTHTNRFTIRNWLTQLWGLASPKSAELLSQFESKGWKLLQNQEELMSQLKNHQVGASLVAQWLRVCLPMQGTRVRALVWEEPTCRRATKPVSHNY